jgi:hypothetical protein
MISVPLPALILGLSAVRTDSDAAVASPATTSAILWMALMGR